MSTIHHLSALLPHNTFKYFWQSDSNNFYWWPGEILSFMILETADVGNILSWNWKSHVLLLTEKIKITMIGIICRRWLLLWENHNSKIFSIIWGQTQTIIIFSWFNIDQILTFFLKWWLCCIYWPDQIWDLSTVGLPGYLLIFSGIFSSWSHLDRFTNSNRFTSTSSMSSPGFSKFLCNCLQISLLQSSFFSWEDILQIRKLTVHSVVRFLVRQEAAKFV